MSTEAYDQAERSQRIAADPGRSVFVTANAGSGKTKVLIDRIARLLLAGGKPDSFLCITYTKAAAAEMQRRLFERLGGWSVLADDQLAVQLQLLTNAREAPEAAALARARALFAEALETPGGLKIQTIHAFCERLLGRFPLEAGVAPGFDILDDVAAAEIIARTFEDLVSPTSPPEVRAAHDHLAARRADQAFQGLIKDLVGKRAQIAVPGAELAAALASVQRRHGDPGTPEAETAAALAATPFDRYPDWAGRLRRGGSRDGDVADRLLAAEAARAWEVLRDIVLTEKGEARSRASGFWVSAKLRKDDPGLLEALDAEADRLTLAHQRITAAERCADAKALLVLVSALNGRYEARKHRRGALDFDDLIAQARALLERADAAPWVLYKLDGQIDHILIDEGQDTSPSQWALVRPLQEEFFAGVGARDDARPLRTVFAVGDPKQSIFGFQGAAPDQFLNESQALAQRAAAADRPFAAPDLTMSFRSSPEILTLVDAVFDGGVALLGPPLGADQTTHVSWRADEPGRVELWPVAPVPQKPDVQPWTAPLDSEQSSSAPADMAQALAATVRRWIDNREGVWDRGQLRPMRPGDVLGLVRTRGRVFRELLRAFKQAGLPVAGADRMVLREELAVEDLLALARLALDPSDDLTLAAVLKGPLIGLLDDNTDLFPLAYGREPGETLWSRLNAASEPRFVAVAAYLSQVIARRGASPFGFFAPLLESACPMGPSGWRAMQERLGIAARDPLEEVLSRAQTSPARGAASLPAFLAQIDADDTPLKREMEAAGDAIRIMTVHGAKGLEAPVVLLADTATRDNSTRKDTGVFLGPDGPALSPGKAADDDTVRALRANAEAANEREQNRLLYVALTRARDRLIVCGAASGQNATTAAPGSWHTQVEAAMARLGAPLDTPFGPGWQLGPVLPAARDGPATTTTAPLPAWAAPLPVTAVETALRPSRASEGPALGPTGVSLQRRRRGVLVHGLLHRLADLDAKAREAAAAAWLARQGVDPASAEALIAETLAVLDEPAFAAAFAPASRGEVPIVGTVLGRPVRGVVDRLAVSVTEVLVIDFKTDRPAPREVAAVPRAYLQQMALYAGVLGAALPGRTVRCALVWTEAPRLLALPDKALADSLKTLIEAEPG